MAAHPDPAFIPTPSGGLRPPRGLLLTLAGLATAVTAGGVAWVLLKRQHRRRKKLPRETSEDAEVASEKKQEEREKKQSAPSWSDLVEEEEALEMQSTIKMSESHSVSLDEEKLSTKLEKLSLETHDSKKKRNSKESSLDPVSDSGMASPTEQLATASTIRSCCISDKVSDSNLAHSAVSICDGNEALGAENQATLSDSGQGSEADDSMVMAYHFYIPTYLCGKLIGAGGQFVQKLKSESNCRVTLRQLGKDRRQRRNSKITENPHELQMCELDGTRSAIDKCLELLRIRFPMDEFPDMTLEQANPPDDNAYLGEAAASPHLGLVQGAMHEVVVSAIVSAGQVFIQQQSHPTFYALERLTKCMQHVYSETETPELPRPLQIGLVCVARTQGAWYRVQIITYDSLSDSCDVKFLDHGGYETLTMRDLRQIRSDFLALPFQAIECYLSNIIPADGIQWSVESNIVLQELTSNKVCCGQMVGYAEDFIPMILLYIPVASRTEERAQEILVNRELVERGVAAWIEPLEQPTVSQDSVPAQ